MKKETPIEVISGMRRGEPRNGRYAIRSVTTAVTVEQTTETSTAIRIARRKLSSQTPASKSLFEVIIPVIAPTMKTSPWAKLMNPSTP